MWKMQGRRIWREEWIETRPEAVSSVSGLSQCPDGKPVILRLRSHITPWQHLWDSDQEFLGRWIQTFCVLKDHLADPMTSVLTEKLIQYVMTSKPWKSEKIILLALISSFDFLKLIYVQDKKWNRTERVIMKNKSPLYTVTTPSFICQRKWT